MKKVKFAIQGMTCSSCASHIDKAVCKLDGVKNVNVNLLSNSMTLEYDEKKLTPNDISKAVKDAGYGATLWGNTIEKGNNVQEDTIQFMKKRVIISFAFLIILMYVSMHHMFAMWIGIPVPSFITNVLDGYENALNYAFIQFLLLLPILYLNRNYFRVGFKRLWKLSPNMDTLIAMRKWN